MTIIEGPVMFDGGIIVDDECLGQTFECKIEGYGAKIELPGKLLRWFETDEGISAHQELVAPRWTSTPESLVDENRQINPHLRESEVPGVVNLDGSFSPGSSVWGASLTVRSMVPNVSTEGSSSVNIGRISCETAYPLEAQRDVAWDLMYGLPKFWFTAKNWIESISLQNLSTIPSNDASRRFAARVMWRNGGGGIDTFRPGGSLGFFYPTKYSITARGLQCFLDIAGELKDPPVEWLLLRDAFKQYSFREYRNAVVSASMALEIILNTYRDQALSGLPSGINEYFEDRKMTLGPKLELLTRYLGLTLPSGGLGMSIVKLRNSTIHRGQVPQGAEVVSAIEEVRDLLLDVDSDYRDLFEKCVFEDAELSDLSKMIVDDSSFYLNSIGSWL